MRGASDGFRWWRVAVVAVVVGLLLGGSHTVAASDPASLIAATARAPRSGPVSVARRPATSDDRLGVVEAPVQVNLGLDGRNIPGDAANEPTVAVDPTDPSRLVLVWRQFDDGTRSLRTAGWATSRDGGRSWQNHGSIEPGELSTDPLLAVDDSGRFYLFTLRERLESCDLQRRAGRLDRPRVGRRLRRQRRPGPGRPRRRAPRRL